MKLAVLMLAALAAFAQRTQIYIPTQAGPLVQTFNGRTGSVVPLVGDYGTFFAPLDHNHNALYAPLGHNHDATYAALVHDHGGLYAALVHAHAASAITSGVFGTAQLLGVAAVPSRCVETSGDGSQLILAAGACGTGASTWGLIGGTLADQTDLKNAIDAKRDASDTAFPDGASFGGSNPFALWTTRGTCPTDTVDPDGVTRDDVLCTDAQGHLKRLASAANGGGTKDYDDTAAAVHTHTRIRVCEIVTGDPGAASPALADDNDTPGVCSNQTSGAFTIGEVKCYADTSTGNPAVLPIVTGGAGDSILTGAIACGNGAYGSAGTLNGTPTLAAGGTVNGNIATAGGTAKLIITRITFSSVE